MGSVSIDSRKLLVLSLVAATVVAVLAVAIWHPQPGAARTAATARAKTVSVKDDFFSPKTVRVAVRGTVTWRWRDEGVHNVVFRKVPSGASKRRSTTRTAGKFTRSFRKRGTYRYVCTIHEDLGMKGSVIAG